MRRIVGAVFVSLDGVMQAPGGPSEDPTGGFGLGGWLFDYFDEESGQVVDALFAEPFDLLLGRRTYDIFAAYWPYTEGDNASMGRRFDRARKYVVTRGDQALAWENSHRVDNLEALAGIKQGEGTDLIIQGSSTLYPQILAAGMLDRLIVMTFPLTLGTGKRLFGEGTPAGTMRLVDHQVTRLGALIATYEPKGGVRPGSFGSEAPSPAEIERQARMARGDW